MQQLFRLFIDVALLKKGPQDVPYSVFLFTLLFVVVFVSDIILLQIPGPEGRAYTFVDVLKALTITYCILLSMLYLVFYMQKKTNRYLQSITALTGFGLLVNILQFPIIFLIQLALINKISGMVIMISLLQMFLFGWILVVNYHIFRQAFSSSMLFAAGLSLSYFTLGLMTQLMLLPEIQT